MLKKYGTTIDKADIHAVCIDDFALKKQQRYGTIMVNAKTSAIIDMIESREKSDIAEWFAGFPNIDVVSYGGSLT